MNASFRRFDINNDIVKTIEQHCCVYIPKTSIYSLQQKDLLPKDYEIEPLVEETVTSRNINFLRYQFSKWKELNGEAAPLSNNSNKPTTTNSKSEYFIKHAINSLSANTWSNKLSHF